MIRRRRAAPGVALLQITSLVLLPRIVFGEDPSLQGKVAQGRADWDSAAIIATQNPEAPLPPANNTVIGAVPVHEPVSDQSLQEANAEVMELRSQVWSGAVAPSDFYPRVKQVYERRFGSDWEKEIHAFLAQQGRRGTASAQTVDFARMSDSEREAFFRAMPKGAELHLHLTGGIPADVMMQIADQQGTELPVENIKKILKVGDLDAYGVDRTQKTIKVGEMSPALRAAVTEAMITHPDEVFADFLNKLLIIGPIISDPRAYYPMMRSIADYAKEQNIVYLELMVTGQSPLLEAAVDASERVQAETGVTIRLIASTLWGTDNKLLDERMANSASLQSRGVVGYNMVANERISPLTHYEAFKKLRERVPRLAVSLHAGEQTGTASNIVNDLLLGVQRFGHATHVEEDAAAAAILYSNRIPVEVSLESNLKTQVVPDLSGHPLPKFLAWNVPVTLCTDDPGVFKSTLGQEYDTAQAQFGLSWDQLKKISRDGILYSFADADTKTRLLADWDRRVREFEASPLFASHRTPTSPQRHSATGGSVKPVVLDFDQ